jgi:small nuclear ribonucleoprotein (snRNP)-like protein
MKITLKILILFTLFVNIATSQERGIILTNITDNDIEFYQENKRVKITTKDNKKHFGRIVIVDDFTISIDNQNIKIEDIIKIKSHSVLSTILSVPFIFFGSLAVVGGTVAGGIGAIVLVPGGAIFNGFGLLITAVGNNHKLKNYTYQISQNHDPNLD